MNHLTASKLPLQLIGLHNNSLDIQIKEHSLVFSENNKKEVCTTYKNLEKAYDAWWNKIYKHLQKDFFDTGVDYMRTCYASMEDKICDINYYLMHWRSWNAESKGIATSRILEGLDKGCTPHGIWGDPAIFMASTFQLEEISQKLVEKGADINTVNTVNTVSKLFQTPASSLVSHSASNDNNLRWLNKLLDWGASPGLTAEISLDFVFSMPDNFEKSKTSRLSSFMDILEGHPDFVEGDNFKKWKGGL